MRPMIAINAYPDHFVVTPKQKTPYGYPKLVALLSEKNMFYNNFAISMCAMYCEGGARGRGYVVHLIIWEAQESE